MSRHWKLDLSAAVWKVLPRRFDGTGNAKGYALAVVESFPNGMSASLPLYTVVTLKAAANDRRVEAAETEDGTDVLGVVVGRFFGDYSDEFEAAAPGASDLVAVMTKGVTKVLIGTSVTRGHYAFVHGTDGHAKGSSSMGLGAFGRFIETSSGSTALVSLGVFSGAAGGTSFGTPALTLGTANAAGAASTAIRTDATILAFDATNPAALGTAAPGNASTAARRNHVHPMPALDDLTDVTAPTPATDDHLAWSGTAWINRAAADEPMIWRPLMDGAVPGTVVVDSGSGEAIMALSPQ